MHLREWMEGLWWFPVIRRAQDRYRTPIHEFEAAHDVEHFSGRNLRHQGAEHFHLPYPLPDSQFNTAQQSASASIRVGRWAEFAEISIAEAAGESVTYIRERSNDSRRRRILIENLLRGAFQFRKRIQWYLPLWCVVFGMDEQYARTVKALKEQYPEVIPQIWHPDAESGKGWFFGPVHTSSGATEIMNLPLSVEQVVDHIGQFLKANPVGGTSVDGEPTYDPFSLMACRHHRTPFPVKVIYEVVRSLRDSAREGDTPQTPAD